MNINPVRKICIGLADEEVLSKNKLRRHLSLVERALIAEELANMLKQQWIRDKIGVSKGTLPRESGRSRKVVMSLDDRAGLPDPAVPVGGPAVFFGRIFLYCRNAWPEDGE
jgi:hypothetical protein